MRKTSLKKGTKGKSKELKKKLYKMRVNVSCINLSDFSPNCGDCNLVGQGRKPLGPTKFSFPFFFSYQTYQNTIFSPFFSQVFSILPTIYPIK